MAPIPASANQPEIPPRLAIAKAELVATILAADLNQLPEVEKALKIIQKEGEGEAGGYIGYAVAGAILAPILMKFSTSWFDSDDLNGRGNCGVFWGKFAIIAGVGAIAAYKGGEKVYRSDALKEGRLDAEASIRKLENSPKFADRMELLKKVLAKQYRLDGSQELLLSQHLREDLWGAIRSRRKFRVEDSLKKTLGEVPFRALMSDPRSLPEFKGSFGRLGDALKFAKTKENDVTKKLLKIAKSRPEPSPELKEAIRNAEEALKKVSDL